MKKSYIILLIIAIIALAIVVTTVYDSTTYSSFKEASAHPEKTFNVIGKLDLNKPMEYNASINANLFAFHVVDNEGNENRVIYFGAKPQDFEKTEQVVMTGNMKGNDFIAKELLLKCPSKYSEKKPKEYGDSLFKSK